MLLISNLPTQDKYVEALTLGPVPSAQKVVYLVANNAAIVQVAGHSEDKTVQPWGDEILVTPTTGEFQRIQGMRFKSAIAGAPAQIVAQLVEPGDPVPIGGTPFTASLSPSGTITPGNASVQVQKNGVLVGTEPILDFVDFESFLWGAMADDVAGTRITIQGPKIVAGYVDAAGVRLLGSGFTSARLAVGNYQITFNPVFGGTPIVLSTPNQNTGANPASFVANVAAGTVQILVHVGGVLTDTPFGFAAFQLA